MSKNLIGIFGGTFDPVHLGHINAVNELNEKFEFEKIHWVLSARPPHKKSQGASIEQRFEMLRRALFAYPDYIADDCEIIRKQKSYTLYTVQHFSQLYPSHQLCLIIGMDSLHKLLTWHRYTELLEQIHLIVMTRPGYDAKVPTALKPRVVHSLSEIRVQSKRGIFVFEQPNYCVSSTHIRARLADEKTPATEAELNQWLPRSVIDYVQAHQIYAQTIK